MASHVDLAELELSDIEAALDAHGRERFHARQIYRWIHRRGITDVSRMTDLSRPLRATLEAEYRIGNPRLVSDAHSVDGTRKFVLELADQRRIESVFIPDTPAMTFCISTQVGCAMACDLSQAPFLRYQRARAASPKPAGGRASFRADCFSSAGVIS